MRPLAFTLVVATLGVGGAALAQPELVVDPWGGAGAEIDSWFGQAAKAPLDTSTADPVLVDPWQPIGAAEPAPRAKRAEVVPVAPAKNASPKSAPALRQTPIVIDPWASVVTSDIPSLDKQSGPRIAERLSPWSGRMIEVVDPWSRVPELRVERVPMIVDPWAR